MQNQQTNFSYQQLLEMLSSLPGAIAIYSGSEVTIEMASDQMLSFWGKGK